MVDLKKLWGIYQDITDPVNLPADAPARCPHIANDQRCFGWWDMNHYTEKLTAADSIATTLYKENPKALKDLLDPSINHFYWGYINKFGQDFYVIRKGNLLRTGLQEKSIKWPKFEYLFLIAGTGEWIIFGAQYYNKKHPMQEDTDILKFIINPNIRRLTYSRTWKDKDNTVQYIYRVDGVDRLNGESKKKTCISAPVKKGKDAVVVNTQRSAVGNSSRSTSDGITTTNTPSPSKSKKRPFSNSTADESSSTDDMRGSKKPRRETILKGYKDETQKTQDQV